MKLLSQTLPQVRHVLIQGGWFAPTVGVSLFALEFFGRQSPNDFYDSLGAAALTLLVALIAMRHRTAPLQWVKYLGRQVWNLARAADRYKFEFGPDLRGSPRIRRGLPGSVKLLILVLASWCAAALSLWDAFPDGWRGWAIQGSYTMYLAGMIGLWGLLFACALGGAYFPFILFNVLAPGTVSRSPEGRISRRQLVFLQCYSAAVLGAWILLPLWLVPILSGAALCVVGIIALWPRQPEVQFIWRPANSVRVYSISTAKLLFVISAIVLLLLSAAMFTAVGGRVIGDLPGDRDMPITRTLGELVAWLTPGIVVSAGIFLFMLWKRNPSRPAQPTVHVSGDLASAVQPQVTRLLGRHGWRVCFEPLPASEVDVRIRLVETAQSQAREFDPDWPLRVSLDDLADGTVLDRFIRRDEIQKRRLLTRGLEKIFKHARTKRFAGGSGFWLAPHLWFMPGLARDEVEERDESSMVTETVGPAYHEVMHRHVRQYCWRLLRDLQIDIIYVEDGIDFRKLKKVLRVMFEVHDKSAGRRRADEVQFQGLPKIKVLIHDFQLDDPFKSETYPEPRFDDLGRARIMHVFRDRGDHEEYVEPPFDFNFEPEPLYVG